MGASQDARQSVVAIEILSGESDGSSEKLTMATRARCRPGEFVTVNVEQDDGTTVAADLIVKRVSGRFVWVAMGGN